MTEIHAYQTVKVPFERIPALLTEMLAACPKDDEGAAVFKLRAPIGDVVLERDAAVRLIPARSYTGYEILDISWAATDGSHGRYPTFFGALSAAQETTQWSRLDLDGKYEPPLGPLGAAFDAVFGHRIAEATANALLASFRDLLEDRAGSPAR